MGSPAHRKEEESVELPLLGSHGPVCFRILELLAWGAEQGRMGFSLAALLQPSLSGPLWAGSALDDGRARRGAQMGAGVRASSNEPQQFYLE